MKNDDQVVNRPALWPVVMAVAIFVGLLIAWVSLR